MIIAGFIHVVVATVLAAILSCLWGHLTPAIAFFSLVAGFTCAWFCVSPRFSIRANANLGEFQFSAWRPGIFGWLERTLFILILFFCVRHFAYLLYVADREMKTLSANNFGDLPLHINYIRAFVRGIEFPPMNPLFSPERLRYPFGVDLYSALWEAIGVHLEAHLFTVGVLASVASLLALRAWGGWPAMGGFFFSGGWAGWSLFRSSQATAAIALEWKNLLLTVFITQRGMLFALPVGALLLHVFSRVVRGELVLSKAQTLILGFFWGSLAFFHLHSFFIISLLFVAYAAVYSSQAPKLKGFYLRFFLAALPIGSLFTFYATGFFAKARVVHWRAWWVAPETGRLTFFNFNFGPTLILWLAVPVLIYLWRESADVSKCQKKRKTAWLEWLAFSALFILFLNLMLAPWDWDNIKILIWPYLALLTVAHRVLAAHTEKYLKMPLDVTSSFEAASIGVLAVVLFFSGFQQVVSASMTTAQSVKLFSLENLAMTEGALKETKPTAVFAAAPTHDHALSYFGCRRAVGYEGHLWSHGIDSKQATADLETLMRSQAGWQDAARRLGVNYIFWGPAERLLYESSVEGIQSQPASVASPRGAAPRGIGTATATESEDLMGWRKTLRNVSPVAGYELYEL